MTGLFAVAHTTEPVGTLPKCGLCGLYKTCQTPKMEVRGGGRKRILIVGEAPGFNEDEQGEQFVGQAGLYFEKTFASIGLSLHRDFWKTNAIICRPEDNVTPNNNQVDWCRPNLLKTIKELQPIVIIPVGFVAAKSVLGPYWNRFRSGGEWVGWKIPLQPINTWVCPTWHPSHLNYVRDEVRGNLPALELLFSRHLKEAVELTDRPWGKVPDYKRQVQIIMDHSEAAKAIQDIIAAGGPVAFDYETDRLKPDHPDAEIVCASICWRGKRTIAFPFVGDVPAAMRRFVTSELPKIGANNKFEDRWTRKILGVPVRNWVWDTMLSAHHLDNRRGITSVKFQAFVRLGFPVWDSKISGLLTAPDSVSANHIRSADMWELLLYCGLDSLVEYLLAVDQKQEMRESNGSQ